MKLSKIKYIILSLSFITAASCSDDSNSEVTDDNQSGELIDSLPDFSGTFKQVDFIGRPETTLNYIIDSAQKDQFNLITVKEQTELEPTIKARLIQMHQMFDASYTYETNYLGLDLDQFSKLMSRNVLQVSLEGETSYRNFTGRTVQEDSMDMMFSQMFGGESGDRFNGQDIDGDGVPDLPILVTDNRGPVTLELTETFPYLENPYQL